jgi:hypothetical protein
MVITVKARLTMAVTSTPIALLQDDDHNDAVINVTAPKGKLTKERAIQIAYEYGSSMAGADGILTAAFKAYAKDTETMAAMIKALSIGYMERKLGYTKEKATHTVGLHKHNPKGERKDSNRTFEEERVMVAVRVLVSRAKQMAGITESAGNAGNVSNTKNTASETRKANIESLGKVVYPAKEEDIDVIAAMTRLVVTMMDYQNKHAAKFKQDDAKAWQNWLASAPVSFKK